MTVLPSDKNQPIDLLCTGFYMSATVALNGLINEYLIKQIRVFGFKLYQIGKSYSFLMMSGGIEVE